MVFNAIIKNAAFKYNIVFSNFQLLIARNSNNKVYANI